MSIFEITDKQAYHDIMNSNHYDIIVLDIYAEWCMPCKTLAPVLNELAAIYSSSKVLFCKLNSELGFKADVKGLPTIEFWVSGKLYHTVMGADIEQIKTILSKLMPGVQPAGVSASKKPSGSTPTPIKTGDSKYKTFAKYYN